MQILGAVAQPVGKGNGLLEPDKQLACELVGSELANKQTLWLVIAFQPFVEVCELV
jgi:hypothetical protein